MCFKIGRACSARVIPSTIHPRFLRCSTIERRSTSDSSITSALRKSNRFILRLQDPNGRLLWPSCTLCVPEYIVGFSSWQHPTFAQSHDRSLYSSGSFNQESKARSTDSGQIASSFGRTTGNKETCLCAEKNSIPPRWAMRFK